mgnify:CR=1 FL=1
MTDRLRGTPKRIRFAHGDQIEVVVLVAQTLPGRGVVVLRAPARIVDLVGIGGHDHNDLGRVPGTPP